MWYSLNGGTNQTFFVNQTFRQDWWSALPNGSCIIIIYTNDTVGNIALDFIDVWIDNIKPSIIINSPGQNEVFRNVAPNFNISIIEGNLDTTWYTLDGGITNITFIGWTGTINQTFWNTLGDGVITIKFYTNDIMDNEAFKEVTIRKDTTSPIIIFDFSEFFLNATKPEYFHLGLLVICTVSDTSGISLVYLCENSMGVWVNRSMIDLGNGNWTYIIDISGLGWSDEFSISFFANDTVGNKKINDNSSILYKIEIFDFQKPSTTISFVPHSGKNNVNESTLFTLTADDGFGSGISVIRYKINDSDWIDYDGAFDLSGYAFGNYLISYYATDAANNIEEIKTLLVNLLEVSEEPSGPIIQGYDLILLLTVIGVISVLLVKRRYVLYK